MRNTPEEIIIAMITGSFLLLVLGTIVIFALVVNNKRKIRYAKDLLDVQQSLLQTISRELHDNVGLLISMAKLNLQLAMAKPENNLQYNQEADLFLSNTLSSLKDVVSIIHSEHSFLHGTLNALDAELTPVRKTGAYTIDFQKEGVEVKLSSAWQIQILRIFRECLNNIIKYAKATRIDVKTSFKNNMFELSISDNGIGFETGSNNESSGIGLDNVRRRAKFMGGDVTIHSTIGKGTCVALRVPFEYNS